MTDTTIWKLWFATYWHHHRDQARDERGDITQTVIIVAIFAAAAIAISAIIVTKFTSKANTIPTG